MRFYQGKLLVIELTEEAKASLLEAESDVPESKSDCKAQLRCILVRLADCGWIATIDLWEQISPGLYVVKTRGCLRAFGWYTGPENRIFKIGLVICSKTKAIRKVDIAAAERARNDYHGKQNHEH